MEPLFPVFFDRIMSPTYHFGGLSYGNLHSMTNESFISYPKKAALQSLKKMNLLREYGLNQYVIPPQLRNYKVILRQMGFDGNFKNALKAVFKSDLQLLSSIFSGSASWVANSFVLTSSNDSLDNNVHITPANLVTCFHRQLEVSDTIKTLKYLFPNRAHFSLHDTVPNSFSDEGAANMIRLSGDSKIGLYIFVYGKVSTVTPKIDFPVRQSKEAFEYIARHHKLKSNQFLFAQQSAKAIEQGVFHNDVICFGTSNCLVIHEDAFENQDAVLDIISKQYEELFAKPLIIYQIPSNQLTLQQAVKTYFFNSQFVNLNSNQMLLICPNLCKDNITIQSCIRDLEQRFSKELIVCYTDLSESIKNGGGPACLRGFAYLSQTEIDLINKKYLLTDKLYQRLKTTIMNLYPDKLNFEELILEEKINSFQNTTKEILKLFN